MLTDYFDLVDVEYVADGIYHWEDVKLKRPIFNIPAATVFDCVDINYFEGKITLSRDAQHWEFLIKPIFLTVPK